MKILFDNGVPRPIANVLIGHEVSYARKIGWHEMKNGELILKAEEDGYELIVTTGKNIRYQQNLAGRKIAIAVPGNSQWPEVRLHLERIGDAINTAMPGSYTEVAIPYRS